MQGKRVSMVGALPPLKGNAYYCMSLAQEMSKVVNVDFISFRKLYPEFLYPGGVSDSDQKFTISETSSLSIRRIVTYYNPLSWLRAGFLVQGNIVHVQWWSIPLAPIYVAMLLVCKYRKKKIVFTVHNVLPHESSPIDRLLTKMVLKFGDAFIVHSERNREGLNQYFGLHNDVIHQVHMPVHDMYEGESLSRSEIRTQLGIPQDASVILSFGNIRGYKGIDQVILALETIVLDVPTAHLLIVGQPWDKWGRYEELIKDLNLQKHVTTVLEYVPMSEVRNYFMATDLVALPYKRFDAQSGVGNIAIAFEVPLVVTRVGGLPELVKDERAVVPPNDARLLAKAISTIFCDDKLYDKLCGDGRVLRREYSWSSAIEKTLFIYEKVLMSGEFARTACNDKEI